MLDAERIEVGACGRDWTCLMREGQFHLVYERIKKVDGFMFVPRWHHRHKQIPTRGVIRAVMDAAIEARK